jgi:hypothetical protein
MRRRFKADPKWITVRHRFFVDEERRRCLAPLLWRCRALCPRVVRSNYGGV